jgi:hypothetical protein
MTPESKQHGRKDEVKLEMESVLKAATEDMKRFYNAKIWPSEFRVGDKVWLSAKNLTTEQPSKKLDYKRLGPFNIVQKVNKLAYKLKLLLSLKVHPVVSTSWLEKVKPDKWNHPQPKVALRFKTHKLMISSTKQERLSRSPHHSFPTLHWVSIQDSQLRTSTLEGELVSKNFLEHLITTSNFLQW